MNSKIKRLCVFSGSSPGKGAAYRTAAIELGQLLVKNDIQLVYGGGDVGLMGVIADSVMSAGGKVIGVIPEFLARKELAKNEVSELHIVQSMHERKALMSDLADGFIAMPGGIGTFEELFEVLTWQQLGIQAKPCALLNIDNYFRHLLLLLDHAVAELFLKPVHRDMLLLGNSAAEVLQQLLNFEHSYVDKWIHQDAQVDANKIR